MTIRNLSIAAVVVLLALVGVSWWRERTPDLTTDQAVAKGRTTAAIEYFALAETVYVASKDTVIQGRVVLRTRRDTLLQRLTDTLRVKEFIATTDTQLVRDSVAIARADAALAASKQVTARVQDELALALKRSRPPRFSAIGSALYDPIKAMPAASLEGQFRVIGRVSLVARGEQRFAPGESPRGYLGLSVRY